jgi:AraC-like DNA-binding protein
MKAYLEKLPMSVDSSWSMLHRRLDDRIPFQWHHHPEYELTLTLNSRGQRFIGDHVANYDDGDLVLIGPNLPHTWSSADNVDPTLPHVALVFWFAQAWIDRFTAGIIEFDPVMRLATRASVGLKFSTEAVSEVRDDCQRLFDLPPVERALGLLSILSRLARDSGAIPLASLPVPITAANDSRERIDRVLTHIHATYTEKITLDELAHLAALSVSGLHRMFVKHTQRTISEYVTQLRIGDACSRLSGTSQPIQHIAGTVGFVSLANFNRHFRYLRGMTPREYRASFASRRQFS